MLELWQEMFSYPFMVRAMIAGSVVALMASLLGVSMIHKRYAMIGDCLSHVAFSAIGIAAVLKMEPLQVGIPVALIVAFLLLRLRENSKIKGDTAIAMVSTGTLAFGVFIVSMTTGMNADVCNYMFGSVLGVSAGEFYWTLLLSMLVVIIFLVSYHRIFALTFDEGFAEASGVRIGIYKLLLAMITAITVVLGMRIMGSLLMSGLIVFPALTSMLFSDNFRWALLWSGVIALVCFIGGLTFSYVYAMPSGASVILLNIGVYGALSGWKLLVEQRRFHHGQK